MIPSLHGRFATRGGLVAVARYGALLVLVGVPYALMAKASFMLASPSPIWPPTGFAIAAVLLWGYRVWPAILIGAFLVNFTTEGSLYASAAIAAGNTLEALVGGDLVLSWSGGTDTFQTPGRIARFALIVWIASSISATVGVSSISFAGFAPWDAFASIWVTWWLGDMAGALVVTPVIVLWVKNTEPHTGVAQAIELMLLLAATALVGLIAFSPLLEQTSNRDALGFLGILPLFWAALRRGPRDTVSVALVLAGFAIWGAVVGGGPFARSGLYGTLNLTVMFMVSVTVPSLVLSAEVARRRKTEEELRQKHDIVEQRAELHAAALAEINAALNLANERRMRLETELHKHRIQFLEAQRLANLGGWSWDIVHNLVSGSDHLFAIFGALPHEISQSLEAFLERIHKDDRKRVEAQLRNAARTAGKFWFETKILRPDGSLRHLRAAGEAVIDEAGIPSHLLGVFHDVTARRQAEEALRKPISS
ncbi:MAG: MASE1 domain-containing protein [Proteobacteria bacterium]|nr:MASE1 domain-containing protein [Pseudomonadota bacterium]MBI3496657.1 MASE1 domain-containing protein [Pseudomonadota bacterium]